MLAVTLAGNLYFVHCFSQLATIFDLFTGLMILLKNRTGTNALRDISYMLFIILASYYIFFAYL